MADVLGSATIGTRCIEVGDPIDDGGPVAYTLNFSAVLAAPVIVSTAPANAPEACMHTEVGLLRAAC
eukprot:222341-Pleurochrysis_carterae.AAC.1